MNTFITVVGILKYIGLLGFPVFFKLALYDAHSPILCSKITEEDKITERIVKSMKEEQISMIDLI